DSPLFVDYAPSRYFLRHPNAARTRGLYELLIEQTDATVYPVRSNRGVNRGYRDPFFRADDSSIVIQGAGTPTIYRGDVYPSDLRGNAFITDSPTNLVHRMVLVDDGSGRLKAENGYARGEFIASSDERFRPVSLFDGPDGNIYVVDMYRGVVQAGVRASAVRLSERWLNTDPAVRTAVLALVDDKNWNVRRQVAASLGEMPAADRVGPAVTILTREGADPIIVDAAISSLKGI